MVKRGALRVGEKHKVGEVACLYLGGRAMMLQGAQELALELNISVTHHCTSACLLILLLRP